MPKKYVEEEAFVPKEAYDDEYDQEYDEEYDGEYDEEYDDLDLDGDDSYEDELPPEERKLRKIGRFRMAAGLFDFVAVILGLVVTLIFVALILTLVNWVASDLGNAFNILPK